MSPFQRGVLVLVAVSTLAAPVVAQSIRVYAHGDLRVVDQVIPGGTDITAGAQLAWSNGNIMFPALASLNVIVNGLDVELRQSVFAYLISPPGIANAIRVRWSGTTDVRGTVRATGTCNPESTFSVDVGADGRFELSGAVLSTQPAVFEGTTTVPAAGVDVIVSGTAMGGFFTFQGSSRVTLAFAPTGQHLARSGSECGAGLEARYWQEPVLFQRGRRLQLDAHSAVPTPFAFFVFGVLDLSVPIPPLGCALRTDILASVPATLDANGRAQLRIPIPESLVGGVVRTQFLAGTLDAANRQVWRTSEVVAVNLQ